MRKVGSVDWEWNWYFFGIETGSTRQADVGLTCVLLPALSVWVRGLEKTNERNVPGFLADFELENLIFDCNYDD